MTIQHKPNCDQDHAGYLPGARSFADPLPDKVAAVAAEKGCSSVLDIDSGSGELLEQLKRRGLATFGVDLRAVPERNIFGFDLTAEDSERNRATKCQLASEMDRSTALTCCCGVLERIDPADVVRALWNLRELSGDWLLASVSTRPSSQYNLFHATVVPRRTWLRLFTALGFRAVDCPRLNELSASRDYPDTAESWAMDQWRRVDPFRDSRDGASQYLLLERAADEVEFSAFSQLAQRLLGVPAAPNEAKLDDAYRLTFLVGHYQEFLLYIPFWDRLKTESFRVLIRSGTLSGLEQHRRGTILAYLRARGIEFQEVELAKDVDWNHHSGKKQALVVATESNATTSHMINVAFVISAKRHGYRTFQIQHGIWPHAEFDRSIVFYSDHVLSWSDDYRNAFAEGNFVAPNGETLPNGLMDETRFSVTGCPKFDDYADQPHVTMQDILGQWAGRYRKSVLVATNLHWPLHHKGADVLPQVLETAAEMPDTLFVYKLHPVHDIEPELLANLPANVQFIDEFASLQGGLSTARLMQACDAMVCTVGTVAIEAALAGRPFVVLDTDNPNTLREIEQVAISDLTSHVTSMLESEPIDRDRFLHVYYDRRTLGCSLQRAIDTINADLAAHDGKQRNNASQQRVLDLANEFLGQCKSSVEHANEVLRHAGNALRAQQDAESHRSHAIALQKIIDACPPEVTLRQIARRVVSRVANRISPRAARFGKRGLRYLKSRLLPRPVAAAPPEPPQTVAPEIPPPSATPALPETPSNPPIEIEFEPGDFDNGSVHIEHRGHLPLMLNELGLKGFGIELGVARGTYSDELLRHSQLSLLFSVDRWSDHHNDEEYEMARRLLGHWKQRSVILRMTFDEAVQLFADGTFDFIYLDGYAHTGQEGGVTMRQWWPKLRAGGIFAGHDYHPDWPATVDMVDQFVAEHQLALHVTGEPPDAEDEWNSWFVRKDGGTAAPSDEARGQWRTDSAAA